MQMNILNNTVWRICKFPNHVFFQGVFLGSSLNCGCEFTHGVISIKSY